MALVMSQLTIIFNCLRQKHYPSSSEQLRSPARSYEIVGQRDARNKKLERLRSEVWIIESRV